jgi:sensor histidine kinase YesM
MKKASIFVALITCGILCPLFSQAAIDVGSELPYPLLDWKYRSGDRMEWGQKDIDDSSWENVRLKKKRISHGQFWLRTSILLKGDRGENEGLGLCIYDLPTALEAYWDGELIGGNGVVGSGRENETPGNVRFSMRLDPEAAEPGLHHLALRVSNFHVEKSRYRSEIHVARYDMISGNEPGMNLDFIQDLGLFLTAFLFSLLIYIGGFRYTAFLFFGGYSLFTLIENFWRFTLQTKPVQISFFYSIESFIPFLSSTAFLLLNLFVISYFGIKRKWVHLALLLGLILVAFFTGFYSDDRMRIPSSILALYALGLTVSKWKRRNVSYMLALTGLAALSAIYILLSVNYIFSITLGSNSGMIFVVLIVVFLSCIMGSISFRIKEQLDKYQEIRLRSQRLETELLKKSIQPHFIMNTLLSIKSWLSKDPAKAEKLIEAFASEFQIINRIASEKEISLDEEIALCRHHLKLMEFRREASYLLTVDNMCMGESIPPMVFHTLIENGLTHAFHPKENGEFHLSCSPNEGEIVYRLQNGGSRIKKLAELASEKIEEGLGLRYIKARLEESYPGNWDLSYGINEALWEVRISIYRG